MKSLLLYAFASLAGLTMAAAQASENFDCHGHIISDGDQKTRVKEHCGEPSDREGSRWIYDRGPDQSTIIVHFDQDVVSLIEHVTSD